MRNPTAPITSTTPIAKNPPWANQASVADVICQLQSDYSGRAYRRDPAFPDSPEIIDAAVSRHFVVSLKTNGSAFSDEQIERMLGHYVTLLEAVAADPDRPISELPLLTEPEAGSDVGNLSTVAVLYLGAYRVDSGAMPIGNLTNINDEERALIDAWYYSSHD